MGYIGRPVQREGSYEKLDAFTFNGADTTFTLSVDGGARNVVPGKAANLSVVVNDVVLEPETDYTVSGDEITFTSAYGGGTSHHVVMLGDSYKAPATIPTDLNSIQDVTISSVQTDDVLKWNGSAWVNDGTIGTRNIANLDGVDITGPATNELLAWDGANWTNTNMNTYSAGDLSDIDLTGVGIGDMLIYGAGGFEVGQLTLDDLSDVSAGSPDPGDALVWNGSSWTPSQGGGGGATTLDGLADVDLTTPPTDEQILVYDLAEGTFKPGDQTGGSGGGGGVDEIITIYVQSDGNDTTGDGSSGTPYATLTKAMDHIKDKYAAKGIFIDTSSSPGDIIESGQVVINHTCPITILGSANKIEWQCARSACDDSDTQALIQINGAHVYMLACNFDSTTETIPNFVAFRNNGKLDMVLCKIEGTSRFCRMKDQSATKLTNECSRLFVSNTDMYFLDNPTGDITMYGTRIFNVNDLTFGSHKVGLHNTSSRSGGLGSTDPFYGPVYITLNESNNKLVAGFSVEIRACTGMVNVDYEVTHRNAGQIPFTLWDSHLNYVGLRNVVENKGVYLLNFAAIYACTINSLYTDIFGQIYETHINFDRCIVNSYMSVWGLSPGPSQQVQIGASGSRIYINQMYYNVIGEQFENKVPIAAGDMSHINVSFYKGYQDFATSTTPACATGTGPTTFDNYATFILVSGGSTAPITTFDSTGPSDPKTTGFTSAGTYGKPTGPITSSSKGPG